MTKLGAFFPRISLALVAIVLTTYMASAQQAKPTAKDSKPAPAEKNASQIELLETKYRFETNGDSRKEVHARVRINNELGARQFARLNFDFNRSFQSVEIPFVRVTHASGGTVDILPSAITDNPNPAVVDYPAYHDVRVKSVRILGLKPDDLLEYRVITTTTHHPLAPDFWLDHTFDRSGVVSHELFELNLPATLQIAMAINPNSPPDRPSSAKPADAGRIVYRWNRDEPAKAASEKSEFGADVSLSSFKSWDSLAERLAKLIVPTESDSRALQDKGNSIVPIDGGPGAKASAIYDLVSKKIKTIDLPLGAMGFRPRAASEILTSGYGTPEDKFFLFATLANNFFGPARAGFVSNTILPPANSPATPAKFDHLLTMSGYPSINFWVDLNLEVAPFQMIPTEFRSRPVFLVGPAVSQRWQTDYAAVPFPSSQNVSVQAKIDSQGLLGAKVSYVLRGDNELLLRVAFHKTERGNWKDVAQMLALSDGFRGQIVDVTASDPYATKEPFTVEYEISQPKFVDWSKKTVRIPAILPLPGLPDAPGAEQTEKKDPIELGTPLTIDLEAAIELPTGATARAPIGTAVNRDYATFSSKYSVQDNVLHASRSLHFLAPQLAASRATDFNAFLHAVQSDQTQLFTIQMAPQK